jgi:hypothetical protein
MEKRVIKQQQYDCIPQDVKVEDTRMVLKIVEKWEVGGKRVRESICRD